MKFCLLPYLSYISYLYLYLLIAPSSNWEGLIEKKIWALLRGAQRDREGICAKKGNAYTKSILIKKKLKSYRDH